jgi:hypothetical protein
VSLGGGLYFGTDPRAIPGDNFVGSISSVVLFTNSLSLAQLDALFQAGENLGAAMAPVIATNILVPFATNYLVNAGTSSSITASAYGGLPLGNLNGYWQALYTNSGGAWSNLASLPNSADFAPSIGTTYTADAVQVGTLMVTNFQGADAGSYQLVFTNATGSATSSVANISLVNLVTNTFAAMATNYGAVGFWPLNETNDPSTFAAVAWDIVGGFNGLYGTNAQAGGTNQLTRLGPTIGPTAPAWTGFPTTNWPGSYPINPTNNSALGVGSLTNGYVATASTPTLPNSLTNSTNATIVAWINPRIPTEPANATIFMQRSNYLNAIATDGVQYANGNSNTLGYHWDNDVADTYSYVSGLVIPSNLWSMVAVVITPGSSTFYVENTAEGLISASQDMYGLFPTNIYQSWGGGALIGSDPGNVPGRNFNGLISSVVMFSNSLSAVQIQSLFDAGYALNNQAPYFTWNLTNSFVMVPGSTVNFTAGGEGGTLTNSGFWMANTPNTGNGPCSAPATSARRRISTSSAPSWSPPTYPPST